jgi:hypothetical protein
VSFRPICSGWAASCISVPYMPAVAAPYLAAALLLVVAGLAKTRDPLSLVRALRAAGLRVRAPLLSRFVRVAAAAEALLGLVAICRPGGLVALAVAASYAGFTAFVIRAMRTGSPLASCGCFGKADTPPTGTHAVVTAVLAVIALLAATQPAGLLPELLVHQPWAGLPLLVVTAVLGYLTYLSLALLPLLSRRAAR